ncbi:MAG: GNAT family N-acetyltransferase [Alkalibacterium sp.]|nr:GNAT family N-acetyltransferase [Alkalibacterium sp.]
MPQNPISYRPLEKKDFKGLAAVISDTWHYEKISSPFTATHLAYAFLYSSLAHHTYTQIAIKEDTPVGLIIGRTNTVPFQHKRYYVHLFFHLFLLVFTSEGKQAIQSFRRNTQVTHALLKLTYESYDGEVLLFAVDKSTRGNGVGSTLFNGYLTYLRSEGARTFYLFTDTSCSYTFYEHKGLKRIGALTRRMPFLQKEISFFLYRGDLQGGDITIDHN